MLLVPFAAGMLYGVDWTHAPLLVAWLSGYLASYYGLLAVKTRRLAKVRTQLLTYGGVAGVALIVVVIARPALWWFAPAFAALGIVNVLAARARRDRAAINGIASVVEASLMALVVPVAAGLAIGTGWQGFAACVMYFLGTVPYIKTMIRERNNPRYFALSVGFHAAAVPIAGIISPWLALPFAAYYLRAVVMPRFRPRVMAIGLIEVAASLVLLGFLVAVR